MTACFRLRAAACGWLVLIVLLAGVAESGASSWRIKKLGGRDYLPVTQVAGFYKLRVVPRGGRAVSLFSDDHSIDFRAGSREARIDGVKQWLSFPVIYFGGQFYVSRMDLSKTIDPVIRPHRIPKMVPVRTVVLDPGHGGHDRGAVNRYGSEKNYNLDLARRIRPYLQAAGLRVVITRQGDQFIPLERRPAIATQLDKKDPGTIFVSIHFNASGSRQSAATGFEIFTLTPRGAPNSHDTFLTRRSFSAEPGHTADHASMALATAIHHAMLGRVPMFDRGVKRARFAVLRRATTPAVLVEGGFMSNPRDARLMADGKWRERLAESMAAGIIEFVQLSRTKKPPKLLASYRAEEAGALAGTEWEYQPLAGIGSLVRPGFATARGWRGLLPAPLGEELPPYRLEFEPRGWAQLEAWSATGEDARSMAVDEQSTLMGQGQWPEPPPPFPGLANWRSSLPPRGLDRGFVLFAPSGGPLSDGAAEGDREVPEIIEISGGAL
ncbi:MAG: N-acetylmuramoyl-L-alanine amidase [Chthoniobacterales bacterium]